MSSETHTVRLDALCDHIWLQTIPLGKLAQKIGQYMPQGGGASGGMNINLGQLLAGE
jgi:hypothetical protein